MVVRVAGSDGNSGNSRSPVGTVRYLVNGEDQGIAFVGVAGLELVPGVWCYGPHDSFEAVAYHGPLASNNGKGNRHGSGASVAAASSLDGIVATVVASSNPLLAAVLGHGVSGGLGASSSDAPDTRSLCQLLMHTDPLLSSSSSSSEMLDEARELKLQGSLAFVPRLAGRKLDVGRNPRCCSMVEGSDPGWNTALVAPGFEAEQVGSSRDTNGSTHEGVVNKHFFGGLHAWEVVVMELAARPHLCIGVAREGTALGDIFGGGGDLSDQLEALGVVGDFQHRKTKPQQLLHQQNEKEEKTQKNRKKMKNTTKKGEGKKTAAKDDSTKKDEDVGSTSFEGGNIDSRSSSSSSSDFNVSIGGLGGGSSGYSPSRGGWGMLGNGCLWWSGCSRRGLRRAASRRGRCERAA